MLQVFKLFKRKRKKLEIVLLLNSNAIRWTRKD